MLLRLAEGRVTRNTLRVLHRIGGRCLPTSLLAYTYEGVPWRVHVDDPMLRSTAPRHVQQYLDCGRSALANLRESFGRVGRRWSDVTACLDVGCGYGRVTRHLVQSVSASGVTACDVDRRTVAFCAAEFRCTPLVLRQEPRQWCLPDRYDLIWVGSVLTHLPEDRGTVLLDLLAVALRSGGLLVFSTQGESCLNHLDWYGEHFRDREREFRDALCRHGVHFIPYPGRGDYGITIHAERYVRQLMAERYGADLRFVRYAPRGWDVHQDVWSFQARCRNSATSGGDHVP